MATITTAGGSGTTTVSSLAANTGQNVNLFTTPATTNATFLVTISCAGEDLGSGAQEFGKVCQMKVGPSTTVYYPVYNAQPSATRNYYITWGWVSEVIT